MTVLQSVESTNNYAIGMVHEGMAKHGNCWLAMEQTAGKGQRGKTWKTSKAENIVLSAVIEPSLIPLSHQFLLSMAIALGCFDFFKYYAGDETRIKWPNDIYWRDRKAGGILIENVIKASNWQFAVAGMGININQTIFAEDLKNPVSLKQITGKTFDIIELSKELCTWIDTRYNALSAGTAGTIQAYNDVLFKRDEKVRLKVETAVFETEIRRVSAEGKLITFDTLERAFDVGDITWML
ncbi:MAG: biotin--[acetyl-CoA-carboxylase] ligase [Chitinophagaceae bacterium]|nr:biotin--[acetyl-CoA-carboxylase] ligase [Chitinophagaceae bacterium]